MTTFGNEKHILERILDTTESVNQAIVPKYEVSFNYEYLNLF